MGDIDKIDRSFLFIFINKWNGMNTQSVKYILKYCFSIAMMQLPLSFYIHFLKIPYSQ